MSDQTPPDPYGEPQPPPAYGQPNPYEPGAPYGQPAPGYQAAAPYSSWLKRVGATIIDNLLYIPGAILLNVGQANGSAILQILGFLIYLGVFVWNVCLQGGGTGYTVGKGVLGIKLINEQTGQPIGPGMAFARQLLHILDSLPCGLGYLWPLWDAKRQTFADKLVKSVVINQPKG